MATPVFYDPNQARWKRVRRLFDVLGVSVSLLIVFFGLHRAAQRISSQACSSGGKTSLPPAHRARKRERKEAPEGAPRAHRKSKLPGSQVRLNQDEGIRAAFYVTWDAASYSSLRAYASQIDLLFPEWLHVLTPDGHLQATTTENKPFDVFGGNGFRPVDDKVMPS